MRIKKIYIPIYDFHLSILQIEGVDDAEKFKRFSRCVNPRDEDVAKTIRNIKNQMYNGGEFYYHSDFKYCFIVLLPHTSKEQFLNSILHEKRHVEDFIITVCGLNGDEDAAYLAGFIGKKMLSIIEEYV